MNYLKTIPTHVWLFGLFVVLLVAYYLRPDVLTEDMLKGCFGALLLSLRTGAEQRPPSQPSATR